MFNKSIVVALIVCACYLGTIDARPGGLDVLGGGGSLPLVGPLATGALSGVAGGATSGLTSGVLASALPAVTGGHQGLLGAAPGITG
ncbi:uncharacterized protein LOC108021882 [Drosophila biarmipes]|uniref:uncharacterized protein LOC108021882 n=1 Tax=Drosophila biarmipes TaxID=125945 RepID=UPI0007E7B6D6|nr:uncharacterized protein LOC108021882 [Drosophila biarmipes]